MTFTAMQPSYMTSPLSSYATQQQITPLQLGQLTQSMGRQQVTTISQSIRQEEQIHPQEHLVSPVTFWAKIARSGVRRGAPAARQVLETVLYQQVAQQQIAVPHAQLGMAMPQLVGEQASLLNGAIQQEEQIHPQEHLVSPQTFWSKVARMSIRHGVEAARQILDVLQARHQVEQQVQEQALQQQIAQAPYAQTVYGQTPYGQATYDQLAYTRALGLQATPQQQAQVYGQQFIPQIPMNPLSSTLGAMSPLSSLGAVSPLSAVTQQQYGQQVSPQYISQQHQQAAPQTPVPAGAAF